MKKGIRLLCGALSLWILVSFSGCNKTFLTVENASVLEDNGPPDTGIVSDTPSEDIFDKSDTQNTDNTTTQIISGETSKGGDFETETPLKPETSSKPINPSDPGTNTTKPQPGKGSANKPALNDTTLFTTYDLDRFTQKIWEGKTVYYETICFFENASGSISNANLLYMPDQILAIRSLDMKKTYTEGKDYTVKGKTITRTAKSQIPYQSYDIYTELFGQDWLKLASDSTHSVRSSVNAYDYQVTVFYTHSGDWTGSFLPESQVSFLPKTMSKLQNNEPLKIVLYGDSIFTGCDTSGGKEITVGNGAYGAYGTGTIDWGVQNKNLRDPGVPAWPELFKLGLEKKYGNTKITKINRASCSTETKGAVLAVQKNVVQENPDLVLIGFGMNQANTNPEGYRTDIETMITKVREENPNAEFLLFSTMVPNTEIASYSNNKLAELEKALFEIRDSHSGVGVVAINSMFHCINDELGKKYFDYSLNNINHPSDFGIMIYAQMALTALGV